MNIYTPFTYIIGWSKHKSFYYGCKYSQGCHPNDLWKSYFTSSKFVEEFRQKFGEPDIIKIHRTFPDRNSCVLFENEYLTKIDAKNHSLFLNESNGGKDFNGSGSDWTEKSFKKAKETWKEKYGVDNPSKSEEIKEKKIQTTLNNWGVNNPIKSEEIKTKIKETCLENWGYTNSLQSPIIREKIKQTNLEIYGFENPAKSEKVKGKIKLTIANYKEEQKEDIKEKRKKTNLEKYGVEFISQIPDNVEKVKRTNLEKYGVDHLCKLQKNCKYCGEYKSESHERQCKLKPNKTQRKTGENNPTSKTFKVTSPEKEVTYIKSVKNLTIFAKERNLKSWTFANIRKYPGWIIEEIEN